MSANLKTKIRVIVEKKDKILFIHKGGATDSWQLPTGMINQGQVALEAASEVASRWGVTVNQPEFLSFNENINNDTGEHNLYLNFKAAYESGKLITAGEKAAQWVKLAKVDLADLSRSDQEALSNFRQEPTADSELSGRYQRALADYQNLMKQSAREKTEFAKYANRELIERIIPVYDNLKVSMQFAKDADSRWLEGVKYVIEQFRSVLAEYGVVEIEASLNETEFDHNLMEASEAVSTNKPKLADKVATVLRPGYTMHGKVIIPSKVAVYKYNK